MHVQHTCTPCMHPTCAHPYANTPIYHEPVHIHTYARTHVQTTVVHMHSHRYTQVHTLPQSDLCIFQKWQLHRAKQMDYIFIQLKNLTPWLLRGPSGQKGCGLRWERSDSHCLAYTSNQRPM
jgi:hypothetical protein